LLSLGQRDEAIGAERDGAIVPVLPNGKTGTLAPSLSVPIAPSLCPSPVPLCPKKGCALPLTKAGLKPGEIVCDLGCGYGAEAIEAARQVAPGGFVYGLDMMPETLAVARQAAKDAAVDNLEFIECFIEDIPLNNNTVDAVISNCALNLSTQRTSVLAEALRILKPGGRLLIADIVLLDASLKKEIQQTIAPVLDCQSGVLLYDECLQLLAQCGFTGLETEVFQQFSTDRLIGRAKKKSMNEALAVLEQLDYAQEINGAFASVYFKARK